MEREASAFDHHAQRAVTFGSLYPGFTREFGLVSRGFLQQALLWLERGCDEAHFNHAIINSISVLAPLRNGPSVVIATHFDLGPYHCRDGLPYTSTPLQMMIRQLRYEAGDVSSQSESSDHTDRTIRDGIRYPDTVIAGNQGAYMVVAAVGEAKVVTGPPTRWPRYAIAKGLAQALTQLVSSFQAYGTYLADYTISNWFSRLTMIDETTVAIEASPTFIRAERLEAGATLDLSDFFGSSNLGLLLCHDLATDGGRDVWWKWRTGALEIVLASTTDCPRLTLPSLDVATSWQRAPWDAVALAEQLSGRVRNLVAARALNAASESLLDSVDGDGTFKGNANPSPTDPMRRNPHRRAAHMDNARTEDVEAPVDEQRLSDDFPPPPPDSEAMDFTSIWQQKAKTLGPSPAPICHLTMLLTALKRQGIRLVLVPTDAFTLSDSPLLSPPTSHTSIPPALQSVDARPTVHV